MILTWTSGVPVSESFEFRDKVVKGLSRMWDTVRNPEVGSLETLILLPEAADLLHRALMLSSATGSLLQSLPEPQFPGLFHGEIICPTNSSELS